MKGSTHLAIGTVIGAAAAVYYPFSWNNAALYVAVSAFSALSADLDGPSMLSSKLGKVSKIVREVVIWAGALLMAVAAYLLLVQREFYPELTAGAVMVFLLGFVAKEGAIRNALVSAVGLGLIYAGFDMQQNWLMGFGLFVVWAPWLKHRGMTHTIWAVFAWGAIGWGLQQQLQIEGIAAISVIGYVSHLVADTLTPSGVKWLYPIYRRSIKLRV